MRKYFSNILFALVAVFAAGCVEVDIYPVEPQTPATVTLQLRNTDLVATRVVDVTDDSQCNEDLIENVQCFFTNSTNADQIIYSSGKIELKENNHGAATITLKDNSLIIKGIKDFNSVLSMSINCNESGSTLRFLIPILSLFPYPFTLEGTSSLFSRPLDIYQKIYN